tara:strand:- start:1589 stop:2875 length:1287 start_codon:yes stop_codon:yes gene_type:complete
MPSANQVKVTIGGAESTAGTAVARTVAIPHRGMPTMKVQYEKAPDPAISGENMMLGKYAVAGDVAGSIPIGFRASAGVGMCLNSILGQEVTPVQIGALIRIRHTGSEASAKIIANTAANTIDADIGDKGSEAADTNWGTAGSIDLTNSSYDTVSELVAAIDGYSEYECEKVFGPGATDAGLIQTMTRQASDGWAYFWFTSASSGAYLHQWPVVLTTTQRPTYSIQIDERQDNFTYAGCVINEFNINAALRGFIEADVNILGFTETGGQSASSVATATEEPMRFHNGKLSVGPYDFTYIRNHSINMSNQHRNEGYGQGSIFRQFHEKGTFKATGSAQVRLNTNADLIKDFVNSTTLVKINFYYTGATIVTDITEFAMFEMPYCSIDDFDWTENEGVIDATFPFEVVKGTGTRYDDPMTVSLVTTDSAVY